MYFFCAAFTKKWLTLPSVCYWAVGLQKRNNKLEDAKQKGKERIRSINSLEWLQMSHASTPFGQKWYWHQHQLLQRSLFAHCQQRVHLFLEASTRETRGCITMRWRICMCIRYRCIWWSKASFDCYSSCSYITMTCKFIISDSVGL